MTNVPDYSYLLEKEFEQTINNESLDDFIKNLKINKLKCNLEALKIKNIKQGRNIVDEYQTKFADLEFNCNYYLNTLLKKQHIDTKQGQYNTQADHTLDDNDKDYEKSLNGSTSTAHSKDLAQLKQKLFQRHSNSNTHNGSTNSSSSESIGFEENIQSDLITEITHLTSNLKRNVKEFDKQLNNSDKDILSKTETNLSHTSSQLSNLGGKLSKFSNSRLGIMFYLASVFFMIIGLLLTYMIIKIFPEM